MLRLLIPLLTGTAAGEVGAAMHRTKSKVALLSVIAFFALAGTVFLLATVYLALARTFGDIHAALFIALGCFTLAIIGLIAIKIVDSKRRRQRIEQRQQVDGSAVLTAAALALLPELMKRPLIAAALPVVALAASAFLFDGKDKDKKRRRPE